PHHPAAASRPRRQLDRVVVPDDNLLASPSNLAVQQHRAECPRCRNVSGVGECKLAILSKSRFALRSTGHRAHSRNPGCTGRWRLWATHLCLEGELVTLMLGPSPTPRK